MWRSKKFIIAMVLAAIVTVGSIGGIALAADNGEASQPQAQQEALLDKVCEIYEQNTGTAIDVQALQDAFAQAQSEMQSEALNNYLQNLVDQGKITQEQADQYKAWLESRPDVPILAPGFPDHGMHRGFGGPGGGFPGCYEPQTAE